MAEWTKISKQKTKQVIQESPLTISAKGTKELKCIVALASDSK
jgi:hypothetical protein